MQVCISLYERDRSAANGRSATPRFRLVSQSTDEGNAQQAAYAHFAANTSVHGLEVGLSGSGEIAFVADADQLRPEVVVSIRRHATEALESLGYPVTEA